MATGLVDSIGVMRLIMYIEDEFDVQVPPEHVTIDNFRTVATIAGYLEKQRKPIA